MHRYARREVNRFGATWLGVRHPALEPDGEQRGQAAHAIRAGAGGGRGHPNVAVATLGVRLTRRQWLTRACGMLSTDFADRPCAADGFSRCCWPAGIRRIV